MSLIAKEIHQRAARLCHTGSLPFGDPDHQGHRVVENRVYLARVTNTGLPSIIDALGREHAALPLFQADALVHTIGLPRVPSLYTRYGDWFAQLCSAATLGLSLWHWRRPGANTREE